MTIFTTRVAPGSQDPRVVQVGSPGQAIGLRDRAIDWLLYRVSPSAFLDRKIRREAAGLAAAAERCGVEVLEMDESFGKASVVQRLTSIPVTMRLHGPWFLNGTALGADDDRRFRRRLAQEGQALHLVRAITSPSHDVLERTRAHYKLPLEMARVIPNPTPSVPPQERWRPDDSQPGTILFVGRFDRHKGGDLIVDAFARVLSWAPDARLWFAGPDRGLEDNQGRRWDLPSFVDDRMPGARDSGRVRLLGHVPHSELAGLRRRAAVVVCCSRYENFPGTVLEAIAAGCPVVAARVGGIPEILRDGVDGQLHRPGDPQDLATAILSLLNDSARAAELGRRAAIRCEDLFSPIAVAARMVTHYRSLVTTRRLPRERVMMPGGMAPQGPMNPRPGLGALSR